jgi:PAS domain S-box-containing protein
MQWRPKSYSQLEDELERALRALDDVRSERDRLARRLADEEVFRAAFRASPEILLLLTPDFRMVDASDARVATTAVPREAFVGRDLFEIFPDNPDNEDAIGKTNLRASLQRVLATSRPDTMALQRYDLRREDGTFEERFWRPLNLPILGPAGEVRYIIHHVEEATAEVQLAASASELRVQQQETRLHAALTDNLLDNVPAGIIYFDADLVVRRLNPTISALLGMPAERMLDRKITEVFPDLDVESLFGPVLRQGETVRQMNFEHRYELDGVPVVRLWDVVNTPVHGDGGRVIGILSMAIEASERAERERLQQEQVARLESENTHKDQFLGIISHELRTPLNAIMGFGSILDDELAGPLTDQQHTYLAKMLGGAEDMLGLVNDLLDMSRIQAGKFGVTPTRVALSHLVADVLADLAPTAGAKAIALRQEVASDLPPVWAERQRISQVVSNLVCNAINFTQAGGWVEVRVRADGAFVRVEVEDNGPGIPQEAQAGLFEPFTQVDMTETRKVGGVGLGLSICKSLVEAHGGAIGVGSNAGKGATFWFTLPIAAASGGVVPE